MRSNLSVDTNDLRQGRKLIKVIQSNEEGSKIKLYVYSDGNEGRMMVPPNEDIDAEVLAEIIRVLMVAYPNISWKLKNAKDEAEIPIV